MRQPTSACSQYGVPSNLLETYFRQGEGRTHFPRLGQDFLSGRTLIPRRICPVGQNIIGRCVPRTHIPADTLCYDTGAHSL